MAHWYLSQFQWNQPQDGSGEWRPPTGATSVIDLRPRSAQATAGGAPTGYGLFTFDAVQAALASDYLGDDPDAALSLTRRTAWRNRLSIADNPGAGSLRTYLGLTLGSLSDPTSSARAKPVCPSRAGRLVIYAGGTRMLDRDFEGASDASWSRIQRVEQDDYRTLRTQCLALATALTNASQGDGSAAARSIAWYAARHDMSFAEAQTVLAQKASQKYKQYLGAKVLKYARWSMARSLFIPGDLQDEGELPPETTVSDDFNRADESLDAGNWTEIVNGWDVVSNQVRHEWTGSTARNGVARYNSDLSSDDHYAKITHVASEVNSLVLCPMTRIPGTSTDTGYFGGWREDGFDKFLWKSVAGTRTSIGSGTQSYGSLPKTLRLDSDGSTQELSEATAGVLFSVTDTDITGNVRCGVSSGNDTSGFERTLDGDNFEAADLAAAASTRGMPFGTRGTAFNGGRTFAGIIR